MDSRRRSAAAGEEQVLDAVYSTLEGFEGWGDVLPRVAHWLGAESALYFTFTEADPRRGFGFNLNIPEEALQRYGAYYHARDLWKDAAAANGLVRAGRQFRSEQVVPEQTKRRSEIYSDLWRPVNVSHMLCGMVTDERDAAVVPATALSLFRSSRRGSFSDAHAQRSARLLPHIRRALLASRRLEEVRRLLSAYQAGLAAGGEVLLLVAPDLTVHHASGEPTPLFGVAALFRIHQGRLWVNDARTRRALESALRDAAAGRPAGAIRAKAGAALEAEIVVVPHRPGQLVIRIRAIHRSPDPGVARMSERYRLTQAERRVVTLLAEGRDIARIALALSIRPATVRTHLARLFEKTGTHSQRELVAVVWREA